MTDPNLDGPLQPPDEVDADAVRLAAEAWADMREQQRADGEA